MPRNFVEIRKFAAPERVQRIPSKVYSAIVGAAVSLAFHALIFTGALWGAGASASRPPVRLADSVSDTPDEDEASMQWIVLDSSDSSERSEKPPDVPIVDPEMEELSADALAPLSAQPELVLANPDTQAPQDAADDLSERSALFGRYAGQINGRVFRAWLRPRSPIGSPSFACRARIEQDRVGNVKEVMLQGCNGDTRWQLSVVHAIQSASPLPAPPDPKVFRREVTVAFQSEAYRDGIATDGFEGVEARLAATLRSGQQEEEFSITPTAEGLTIRIIGHPGAAGDQASQNDETPSPAPDAPPDREDSEDR